MYPTTKKKCNCKLENKEFVLQRTRRGFRCISWHPHYIMTNWVRTKKQAIEDGNLAIEKHNKSVILS